MPLKSSQKFIGRNRPPRVQIEYDVETYGSEKKVQLPFVMGVMADLAGKPKQGEEVIPVQDRKFQFIDADNFEQKLKAFKPHVAFRVPNTLTGEGMLPVDITFESMDDFSPVGIARKVNVLRELLEARTQLDNLLTLMDGKVRAEEVILGYIKNPALQQAYLEALASAPQASDQPAADQSTESPSEGEG